MSPWPYPRIVAHRGGGTLAPENTLAAIRHGASLGFKGVEFDVMLSGDSLPILIHDETLERTTSGKGGVAAMPYAELRSLDAGGWKGERWRGERIPAFEEAGRLCRELGVWANVEIKPAAGFERATGTAASILARELWQGASPPCLLSSFAIESLEAAQAAVPELPRGYLVDRIPDDWYGTMKRLECVALHCNQKHLTRAQADAVHAAGYSILCWTVNDPAVARRLLSWGVECLVTDVLDVIGPGFA